MIRSLTITLWHIRCRERASSTSSKSRHSLQAAYAPRVDNAQYVNRSRFPLDQVEDALLASFTEQGAFTEIQTDQWESTFHSLLDLALLQCHTSFRSRMRCLRLRSASASVRAEQAETLAFTRCWRPRTRKRAVDVWFSIGIVAGFALPIAAYWAYIAARARAGAVPKKVGSTKLV